MEKWRKELKAVASVLNSWVQATNEQSALGSLKTDAAALYRDRFTSMGAGEPTNELVSFARCGNRTIWNPLDGFHAAAGVEVRTRDGSGTQALWPLIAFALREKNSTLEMSVRVGIFYLESDQIGAYGWRFDSPDSDGNGTGPAFHHYAHVQAISSWAEGKLNFMPPGSPTPRPQDVTHWVEEEKQVLETRPAFPLACTTPAGLLVAVLVSIYGGRRTLEIIAGAGAEPLQDFHRLTSNTLFRFAA